MIPVAIVCHGGAWNISDALIERAQRGCLKAVEQGWKTLEDALSSIDTTIQTNVKEDTKDSICMEAAISTLSCLEDDSTFDSGYGSVLTKTQTIEMDAMVFTSCKKRVASVIGVDCVRHPAWLARKVLEETPHVCLAGKGAKEFAKIVAGDEWLDDPLQLVTQEAKEEWKQVNEYAGAVQTSFVNDSLDRPMDTCGCIVLFQGELAGGTTTGGVTYKMPGRVGDSPMFGAGGYVDSKGACSTTGHGESIVRSMLAMDCVQTITSGVGEATKSSLKNMLDIDGYGGLICMNYQGDIGIGHTTKRMAWGVAKGYLENGKLHQTLITSGYLIPNLSDAIHLQTF